MKIGTNPWFFCKSWTFREIPDVAFSKLGSLVQRLRSRNSSWRVVTSEVDESGDHLGAWPREDLRWISEYGIPEYTMHQN